MIARAVARLSIVSLISFCISIPCLADQLPSLGNEFRSVLSVRDEKLIGEHWMRELRSTGMLYRDPIVQEYIRYVGNRLTPYMPTPYANLKLTFVALDEKTVNAFAFFGGHLAVHSGLLLLTDSESELAGVMSHELAHISQQHVLRQLSHSKRTLPLTIASTIAAAVLGGPEMLIPVLAGHMQQTVNYTREFEKEADRVGMQILANARFDPNGLPNIFERMNTHGRYQNKPPEYISTHPLYESRISDTRHRASTLKHVKHVDSSMYHLVKARVAVQQADSLHKLIPELEHKLSTTRYKNELYTKYAYAYALHKNGKNDKAMQIINALLVNNSDNLIIQMTTAEIEADNGKYAEAQIRLENLLGTYSDSPSLKLQYIELLTMTSQPQLATKTLDKYKEQHAIDLSFYELQRHAYGMLNNRIGVYEANAEWFFLNSDYLTAVKQLDMALAQQELDDVRKNRITLRKQEIKDLQEYLEQL